MTATFPAAAGPGSEVTQAELDAEIAARAAADATHAALTTGAHNLAAMLATKQDAATAATDAELATHAADQTTHNLPALLATKADLVGGVIPTGQIPAIATGQTTTVASQAAMLGQTAAQVQPGDVTIRSDLAGCRFLLAAADPSQLPNWIALEVPDTVSSVNGQQGAVVLGKTDVGLSNVDNTADTAKAIAGDVAGTLAAASVTKIRGKTIPAPGAGQDQMTWKYDHASGAMVWVALPSGGGTESLWWPNLVAPADPALLCGGLAVMGAGQARSCRVGIPKTGQLRDLAIFVGGQSGNVDIGVYSTGAVRTRLYSSGSVPCPAANNWRIVADPNLAVTKGDQLDLMLGCDNASAAFGRIPMNSSTFTLPAGFLPGGGGLPKIAALIGAGFPLPATFNEGDLSDTVSCIAIIGRIS